MSKLVLQLFIRGDNPRHQRVLGEMRLLCSQLIEGSCELEVVDIVQSPQLAERHKILATPALIRALPAPEHRIIGDLCAVERVLAELGLEQTVVRTAPATETWT